MSQPLRFYRNSDHCGDLEKAEVFHVFLSLYGCVRYVSLIANTQLISLEPQATSDFFMMPKEESYQTNLSAHIQRV